MTTTDPQDAIVPEPSHEEWTVEMLEDGAEVIVPTINNNNPEQVKPFIGKRTTVTVKEKL